MTSVLDMCILYLNYYFHLYVQRMAYVCHTSAFHPINSSRGPNPGAPEPRIRAADNFLVFLNEIQFVSPKCAIRAPAAKLRREMKWQFSVLKIHHRHFYSE